MEHDAHVACTRRTHARDLCLMVKEEQAAGIGWLLLHAGQRTRGYVWAFCDGL
jgi:hypothetical protein